jgi:FkbM family methyltransferase
MIIASDWLVERDLWYSWPGLMQDKPVILDIGANRGLTGFAFRQRFPKARIIGFEPHPNMIERCIKLGVYDEIHAVALSCENSSTALRVNVSEGTMTGNIGDSDGGQFTYPDSGITVPTRRLDDFNLQPDFIKVDVDGSEMLVLSGGIKTFQKCRATLIEVGTLARAEAISRLLGMVYTRLSSCDYLYL